MPILDDITWPKKRTKAEEVVKDLCLRNRFIIVTGANTGLGLESARVLAGRGAHVVLACRNADKAAQAKQRILQDFPDSTVEVMELDLSSLASVEAFAAEYTAKKWQAFLDSCCFPAHFFARPLHVLMLNAGVYNPPNSHTSDGFESTFQVNHLSQWYLIQLLLGQLRASAPSRIVLISALAHKHANLRSAADCGNTTALSPGGSVGALGNWRRYANSKLANILTARAIHSRFDHDGITAFAVHPGIVRTEFARHSRLFSLLKPLQSLLSSPEEGAAGQTFLATGSGLEALSGEYFSGCFPASTSSLGRNDKAAALLWELSATLLEEWKERKDAQ